MKKILESENIKKILIVVVALAIVFGAFQAGIFVGFHKASFLFRAGDNFYRAFDGERGAGMMERGKMMFRDEFSGGHGAAGKVISVNLPNLVVLGPDNLEKTIIISSSTQIHQFRDVSSTTALAVDQFVTVLGEPNDQGQVVAKFIRIMPAPTPSK